MQGLALLGLSGFSGGGGGAAAWTPAEDGALFWIDIPAARAGGRLFTTSAKATAAVAVADPVGAIVQEGSLGSDLIQATSSRRYYLTTLTDGQYALGSDGIDDACTSNTVSPPLGAKTVGFRVEYFASLGSTESDVLLNVGSASASFRVYMIGTGSANKGISFCADIGGTAKIFRRYSGLTVTSGVPFTIIIAYNGGAIDSTSSYKLFVDGVEVTIDATGGSTSTGAAIATLLCYTVASAPATAKMSKLFMVTGDQSSKVARIQSYLVAP